MQGALTQCRKALKPDGLLLGALLGGESLQVCFWVQGTVPLVIALRYICRVKSTSDDHVAA